VLFAECPEYHDPPKVTQPTSNVTTERRHVNDHVIIACEAVFGRITERDSGTNLDACWIGWNARPLRNRASTGMERIDNDPTKRVHSVMTR